MKAKSVKVRIAVAVDNKGRWSGYGWSEANVDALAIDALDNVNLGMIRHAVIVEAVLPLPPSPETIGALVKPVKGRKK